MNYVPYTDKKGSVFLLLKISCVNFESYRFMLRMKYIVKWKNIRDCNLSLY